MLNNMINLYGADGLHPTLAGTFAVVEYHVGDPYDETYCYTRASFYNIPGTPSLRYDGIINPGGSQNYAIAWNNRRQVPTTVLMDVGAEEVVANVYDITVRTCVEEGAATLSMRIYTMFVEDHYPSVPSYSRNTFRLALPNSNITVAPGECIDVIHSLVNIQPNTTQDNLKIVAWAQEYTGGQPYEVYQAAMETWPFESLEQPIFGDLNDDGIVDATDLALLLGDWGPVDPCTTPIPADLNEDCVVNAEDLALLLGNWS